VRRNRSLHPFRRAAALAVLACCIGVPAAAASVTVLVEGASTGAPVLVSLCAGGLEPQNCPLGDTASARSGAVRFRFDVAPGVYAAAAFQDLNGNGRLDRTPIGLPLEPYAFSNGVGRSAPPRFARAAFRVEGDTLVRVRLALPPAQPR